METEMRWTVKPNDVLGIRLISVQHAISSWVRFLIFENPLFVFYGSLDIAINWEIGNYDEMLSHDEVMDHPWCRNWNVEALGQFSVFIEQRIMNNR